jgi:hypothetical protein
MPRYFFHLSSDGRGPADGEQGEEFSGLRQVATEALAIARELAKNRPTGEISGTAVVVTDEAGVEVFRVPLYPT